MQQVYNNSNIPVLESARKWMKICQITMKILVNHSPMIAWNKEHETILIECNMTSPNGWKYNYCRNDYIRDDSKQLMQSVRL